MVVILIFAVVTLSLVTIVALQVTMLNRQRRALAGSERSAKQFIHYAMLIESEQRHTRQAVRRLAEALGIAAALEVLNKPPDLFTVLPDFYDDLSPTGGSDAEPGGNATAVQLRRGA